MFRRNSTITKRRGQRAVERPPPPSIISINLRIRGDLHTDGDVQVDGTVEGDVSSRVLNIGEKAVINGSIAADTVRIAGAANGEITARIVQLSSTARVIGDINHQSLSIDAGAYVQGLCRQIEQKNEAQQVSSVAESGPQVGGLSAASGSDVQPVNRGNAPDPRLGPVKVVG
jgi:cytoskeletal protein CcmA (bactofilin family)